MNLSAWIDVAIGLGLVYIGASLFVTVINEYVAQFSNLRGKQLCESLKTPISDPHVKNILAQSPALKPFFDKDAGKTPSYVDPNVLGQLLVGGLADPSAAGEIKEQVSAALERMPNSELKTQLQALVRTAGTAADALVKSVSDWADRSLTMLGEGYKRKLQLYSFLIGLLVAIGLNLDTVALTAHLYRDKDAREAAVSLGVQIAAGKEAFEKCIALSTEKLQKDESCAPVAGLVEVVRGRNASLGKLPIGWPLPKSPPKGDLLSLPVLYFVLIHIAGWLLTALALSLGAPFWFDLLNKLVNVRYGMRKPEVEK